jgi:hypothetical protein
MEIMGFTALLMKRRARFAGNSTCAIKIRLPSSEVFHLPLGRFTRTSRRFFSLYNYCPRDGQLQFVDNQVGVFAWFSSNKKVLKYITLDVTHSLQSLNSWQFSDLFSSFQLTLHSNEQNGRHE